MGPKRIITAERVKEVHEWWRNDQEKSISKGKKKENTGMHPNLYQNPPQPGTVRWTRTLKKMKKEMEGEVSKIEEFQEEETKETEENVP